MNKKILFSILLILSYISSKSQTAFPYINNLSSNADFTFPGFVGNIATIVTNTTNENGLRLTTNNNDLIGTAILNKSFSSTDGIKIEFDYVIYGTGVNGADGLTFYLFDGSSTLTSYGTSGASLGYTYRRTSTSENSGTQGLSDAYIGVALDVFGNFKQRRSQGSPAEYVNGLTNTFIDANTKSHITIRGAAGKSSNVSVVPGTTSPTSSTKLSNYLYGYPVLYTRSTKDSNSSTSVAHMVLDPSNGTYTEKANVLTSIKELASGSVTDVKTIILEVVRNPNVAVGGSLVTVSLKDSAGQAKIIDKFLYPKTVVYYENQYSTTSTTTTLTADLPNTFKVGFTGATGGLSNAHLIKNIKITVPYAAEPANDNITVCAGGINTINVTTNDIGYSGSISAGETGSNPTSSSAYVDKASFSFINSAGQNIGYSMTTSRGTYNYDPSNGNVTYIPLSSLTTGTETISYTIKGSVAPYNTENHRGIATITSTISGTVNPINGSDYIILGKTSNYTNTSTGISSPWSTSNSSVITVSNSGVVTAVGIGTANLIYSSSNGCKIQKSITVYPDTDGDGVHDGIDLDSDNDGILNSVEMLGTCSSNSIYSMTGYQGKLYDNYETEDINSWNQYVAENRFPTSSYHSIASFEYYEFEKTNKAFDIVFKYADTNSPNGFRSNNTRQLRNFSGTGIYSNSGNYDFAVEFTKVIRKEEEGTYDFKLNEGDNHVIIFKNNVEIFKQNDVWGVSRPLNVGNISFVEGDVFRVVWIEEGTYNTQIDLRATKIAGQCIKDTDGDGIPDYLDTDSDNDGCPDAIEGAGTITSNQLKSNQSINSSVDANGVPTLVNGGQGIGSAANAAVNACICTKPANTTGTALSTNVGITTVTKDADWPQKIKGAHMALESRTKGLVINKIKGSELSTKITHPKEGMVVYDTDADCLKIYSKDMNASTFSWKCFNTQSCPDN